MINTFKAGTRPSPLALKQVEEIQKRLPRIRLEAVVIETRGDRDKVSSLWREEETDFFTREIEQQLLDRSIDIAVHSAKDLEVDMPEEFVIAAMTNSISPHECLVSLSGETLGQLHAGAVIGTSSAKRKAAIFKYRGDLIAKDIRGNIEDRLRQLDNGDFDAVIVAHAAMMRLGLWHRISQIIPADIIEPHPLQGRIAVQVRKDRKDLIKIFKGIHAN